MKSKKLLAGILSTALVLGAMFPLAALAEDEAADATQSAEADEAGETEAEPTDAEAPEAEAEDVVTYPFIEIRLDHNMISLAPGGHVMLHANASLPSGVEGQVKWSSSDDSIAYVTSTGRVYAQKTGETIITASIGGISVSCPVVVSIDPLPYDGPVTSAVRRGFTKAVNGVLEDPKTDSDLAAWAGVWNSVAGYLANDDVADGLAALEADDEMEEGSLAAGFTEMFAADFAGIRIGEDTITFYDEAQTDPAEANGEVVGIAKYALLEVVGEGADVWCVFESADENAPCKYIMLSAVEVDETAETYDHFRMVYGDDLDEVKASEGWYPTMTPITTTDAQVLAGLTAFLAE